MKVLSCFAEGRKRALHKKDSFFLQMFVLLLKSNSPREIARLHGNNVVISTDACYERDAEQWICGLGGVICLQGKVQYFSLEVDLFGREVLGEAVKKQIIFEAETLAAVIAFSLWKNEFSGTRCLLFVDNEGTKFSLLKGSSDNATVDLLAGYFAEMEATTHSFTWISRVPSKSNIADLPSRNDVGSAFFRNALDASSGASSILRWTLEKLWKDGGDAQSSSHLEKKRSRFDCVNGVCNSNAHVTCDNALQFQMHFI